MKIASDPLLADTGLNEPDYEFLKGNSDYWRGWGAALNLTYEYCMNNGYGNFGLPTTRGKKAMEHYEREHLGLR